MKQIILIVALVGAMNVAVTAQTRNPAGATQVEQELMQMECDFSAAYLKHDTAVIDRILADDYVGIDGRAVVANKAEEIAEARAPSPGTPPPDYLVTDETISDMKVRAYGDAAVVTSLSTEKVLIKGNESTTRYRRTTVYIRRQGRWQCVSFHASRIIEPKK
jgi:ketosteroid isomerase-like protein